MELWIESLTKWVGNRNTRVLNLVCNRVYNIVLELETNAIVFPALSVSENVCGFCIVLIWHTLSAKNTNWMLGYRNVIICLQFNIIIKKNVMNIQKLLASSSQYN